MQSSFFESTVENPVIEQETRTVEELDLPWQVVVHNDPVNLMSYVTMVFQKVFGLTKEKAEVHMLEVHQLGRSILWSGMRERAELYVQQLHGYLLLATLERTN
jgi:ATP-dependent Clp protease adaptor protein ClpS